ncbi:MAG: hypothetical protein KDA77_22930, partial [Planctomycetaceae bacterium]|nr:hypothetical protein [Planctomycetaceae bacterium]
MKSAELKWQWTSPITTGRCDVESFARQFVSATIRLYRGKTMRSLLSTSFTLLLMVLIFPTMAPGQTEQQSSGYFAMGAMSGEVTAD